MNKIAIWQFGTTWVKLCLIKIARFAKLARKTLVRKTTQVISITPRPSYDVCGPYFNHANKLNENVRGFIIAVKRFYDRDFDILQVYVGCYEDGISHVAKLRTIPYSDALRNKKNKDRHFILDRHCCLDYFYVVSMSLDEILLFFNKLGIFF